MFDTVLNTNFVSLFNFSTIKHNFGNLSFWDVCEDKLRILMFLQFRNVTAKGKQTSMVTWTTYPHFYNKIGCFNVQVACPLETFTDCHIREKAMKIIVLYQTNLCHLLKKTAGLCICPRLKLYKTVTLELEFYSFVWLPFCWLTENRKHVMFISK